jgi:hypothetical protein
MDAKMIDEKFEHRKGSTVEDGMAFGDGELDAAVVKKTLWKMDVRYVLVGFENINTVADDDIQDPSCSRTSFPLLVHRPHQRGQCEDSRAGEGYPHHGSSVRDWTLCVLCDVYRERVAQ